MSGDQPALKVMWKDHEVTASVASVQVEDDDRLTDQATIVLRDPHVSAPELAAGDPITVTLGWDREQAVLFSGQIVQTPAAAPASGTPTVTIVAYDLSYLMNQATAPDSTHTGALSEIVQSVVRKYSTITLDPTNIVCDPNPTFTGDPALRQHDLTDLQFLQWLGWRYGHRAFVEFNDDKNQFYFVSNHRLLTGKPLGALLWCHGTRQLKSFSYNRVASRAVRQRLAATPDPRTGLSAPTVGQLPAPLQPAVPNPQHAATLGRLDPAERARYESGARATPPPTPEPAPVIGLPSDPHLAEAVTVWDPTQALGLRGQGVAVGTIKLRAKGKVTIEGVAPWAEGDWYVNKAVHNWRDTTMAPLRRDRDRPPRHTATYETSFTVTR